MEDASREGLAWDDNGLGPEPRWTREPDIKAVERVCRRQLGIPNDGPGSEFAVAFHADGTFNKLYRIQSSRGRFMLRVSLPVDPHNKTRGEAATLQLVRRITDIPVPAVVAFDDSRASEIGFEWLLMNMVPGTPAYYRWRIMSMEQKERLTARVADFQAQLFRCGNLGRGFRGIGTLGTSGDLDRDGFPEPGQIVSAFFFSGKRYQYPIPRGPFRSSHDWLRAHLNIIIRENTTALAEARDEEARQSAEAALRVARKLLRMLHKLFPAIVNPPERTVLWHEELSLKNIMVDGEGGITGVIGWECTSTMPRWVASQVPEFLRGTTRETKPDRNCYTDVDKDGSDANDAELDDNLDNEGKTELYWIHLMEYEQTQLRKVYAARMRQLRPEWDIEVEEDALKVDFLAAALRCGAGFYLRRIEQWIDAVERKEFLPLMEVLRVGIKKDKDKATSKPATSNALTLASRLS